MPAICQNVANWRTNAALSGWHVGSNWDHWFTYDLGASKSTLDRGDARRELQCPRNWKVQPNGRPTCPMAGQPQVVPPLWDANGLPVTQIIPQVGTQVYLKIADGRDQQFVGQTQDSGRMYSCDEFPPASWIEGGHGIGGTPTAAQGTTYCAPIAVVCLGDDDARGSEQNWQGSIHKVLSTVLETRIGPDGDNLQYDVDTPIAFRFTTSTQPNNVVWAARVLTDYGGVANQQERKPGTHWQRRSDDSQPAEILLVPIENGNGSSAIHLSNGEVFRPHEHKSLDPLLHRIRQLARREAKGPAVTEVSNQTASVEWYVSTCLSSQQHLTHALYFGLRMSLTHFLRLGTSLLKMSTRH
jgi:chitinase